MTANLPLWMALFLAGNVLALGTTQQYTGPGSTKNLKEIIIGRCSEYLLIEAHHELVGIDPLNCKRIWKTFKKAFAGKPPCQPGSYRDFVAMTMRPDIPLPQNKALFWSGTMGLASELADNGRRNVVLANILTGYLVKDNLQWCGKPSRPLPFTGDGIDYEHCPTFQDCDYQGEFWSLASKTMAERATGNVYVLLNGTRGAPAYNRGSFFAKYELPNLQPGTVHKVTALLAHDIDREPSDVCGAGSLKELEEDVEKKGFEFVCLDDPLAVRHLLCVNTPDSEQCKFIKKRF